MNGFLTDLAVERNVAAATQNQALSAILFLYAKVLSQPLDRMEGLIRAKKPKRLPVVLSRVEVVAVLGELEGIPLLLSMLQYGSGVRVTEALSVRVKDLDFGRGEFVVRDGKGEKDRVTMLPEALHDPLRAHLRAVREQHERDLARGWVVSRCRRHWRASTPTWTANGPGSASSRRDRITSTG